MTTGGSKIARWSTYRSCCNEAEKNCMAPCARERSETGCQFYLDPNVANFTRPREAKFHACNSHITCIVIASVKLESMQRRWRSRDRGLDREPAPLQWHQQLGFDSGCTHVFADRCRLVQNERERERHLNPVQGLGFVRVRGHQLMLCIRRTQIP